MISEPHDPPRPPRAESANATENAADESWRNRRMTRGRWRAEEQGVKARVDRAVCVKMTEPELEAFDLQIAAAGLTRNRALRIAARKIGGYIETDKETVAELREITRQITGVARNINQIAKAANRGDPNYAGFMAERRDLGRQLARVEGLMQRVLNASLRRSDAMDRIAVNAGEGRT